MLTPHYPFLESLEGDADPPPDADPLRDTATAPPPDTAPSQDTAPLPDTAPLWDTALAPPPDTAPPPDMGPPAPASRNTCPEAAELAEPQVLSRVPGELSAAFPSGDEDTEGDEDAAGRGQRQEQVLVGSAQDEALVPAEPGALRYLQRHYQDLLASIPEVSLLPLEGEDVAGFRVSCGQRCGQGSVPVAPTSPSSPQWAGSGSAASRGAQRQGLLGAAVPMRRAGPDRPALAGR